MKPENAIEVKNITKSFKVYKDKGLTLKEMALFSNRRAYEERKVLDGISFEVKKGEAIGLIGHNGCGKSTTLKILTRIMYPDTGTVELKGRVSSLIELGAGFHPDMSGRENIYINASIFGLTKKEIDKRLDDIIAFSELEEFIDNPVRTYSSGMYMRLAFSVAINVNADILLIDEILAVGDAGFQTKCFNRLKEIKAEGTTIVIVSHSLGQIEQICEKSYWIHKGKIVAEGAPRDVHPLYMQYMAEEREEISRKELKRKEEEDRKNGINIDGLNHGTDRRGTGKVRVTSVRLLNENGEENKMFSSEKGMTIEIGYHVNQPVEKAVFGIGIFRIDGMHCYGTNTRIDQLGGFHLEKDGKVEIHLDKVQLLSSHYYLDVAITEEDDSEIDYFTKASEFDTFSTTGDVGVMRIPHHWEIDMVKGAEKE